MEKSILINAGLTPNESEVYLALLEKEESVAGELAAETKISRPHVYDSINKLMEKGLVSYVVKKNKRYFRAANPKELLSYLEDNKRKVEEKEKQIQSILPQLLRLHKPKKRKPVVEVYEGKGGFKTIFKDILNVKKDFIAFGASGKFEKVLPMFSKIFIKQRELLKIKAKLIAVEGTHPVKTRLNVYRWIPKEFSSPASTVIYGEKVAVLLWLEEPLGIIIKSKEVVESYKHYFELLWKMGKIKS